MRRAVVVRRWRRRLDAFCRRLNDGLTAVAIVLALLTALTGVFRLLQFSAAQADRAYAIGHEHPPDPPLRPLTSG